MNKKINDLADKIIRLYNNENSGNTWNEHIEMMQLTLSLILDAKENKLEKKDLLILKALIPEALNFGLDEMELNIRSPKRLKLYELTTKVKEEMNHFSDLKYQEEKVTDLNSWIKSLKIFKMGDNGLEDTIYQTSYELYQDMRKIILKKNNPIYKKIYLGQIVDKLEKEDNQKTLPPHIKMIEADYELYQIMRLVKKNLDFNYKHTTIGILAYEKAINLNRQTNIFRVAMLIKNQ